MKWTVEMADEFEPEFDVLDENVQSEILALAIVLEEFGPQLGRPRVDTLNGSRHANAADAEWRVAFAFDPRRAAISARCGRQIGWKPKALLPRTYTQSRSAIRCSSRSAEKGTEISMPVNIREKIAKLNAAQQKRLQSRAAEIIAEQMSLRDLRKARKLTQARVAKALGINQDSVSRLEKRSDLLLSTLRKTVKAMGGDVRIVAEFPDRAPVVLSDLPENEPSRKSSRRHAHD